MNLYGVIVHSNFQVPISNFQMILYLPARIALFGNWKLEIGYWKFNSRISERTAKCVLLRYTIDKYVSNVRKER